MRGKATYVGVDAVGAVVLVAVFAGTAGEAAAAHGANADGVADFDALDAVADVGRGADDLVANDEGELGIAPALGEGVDVGAADAAVGDGELDVVWFERLRLEFDHLEVIPFSGI